ncbi:MAG: hypothetical protein IJI14_14075 [Anaerolineaceae bacterium]|nr:hypothetical protein [Anaerolineaceae bacterium]
MSDSHITKKTSPLSDLPVDSQGRYRWTYEMVSSENHSYRDTLMIIFALVILIPGVILFFMIFGRNIQHGYWSGTGGYIAILLGVLAVTELLVFLIYQGVEKVRGGSKSIPYAMDETCIDLYPDDYKTPRPYIRTDYSSVVDIKVKPQYDEIDLLEVMRITQIYVYPEDRAFVLNYLFDHLPQRKKILERREQYRKYLEK